MTIHNVKNVNIIIHNIFVDLKYHDMKSSIGDSEELTVGIPFFSIYHKIARRIQKMLYYHPNNVSEIKYLLTYLKAKLNTASLKN